LANPDWPAFLAAIVADPDDDTARLAAADFLAENGEAGRAAFVRVQVELARLEAAGEAKSLRADELRAKERMACGPLALDWKFWAAQDCPEIVKVDVRGGLDVAVTGAERLEWRRGFVEVVSCGAEEWLRHGAAVRARNPVRTVVLGNCLGMDRGRWWALLPLLRGLRSVVLTEASLPAEFLDWLRNQLPGVRVEAVGTAMGVLEAPPPREVRRQTP
jgi:uncharacterized protein (TIGR02996 family)